ncbi:hypothetical protein ACFX13_014914 [Malus domestica]
MPHVSDFQIHINGQQAFFVREDLSYNKISGKFPVGFTKRVPENSTINLHFNKLDRIDTGLAASVQSENISVCRKQ